MGMIAIVELPNQADNDAFLALKFALGDGGTYADTFITALVNFEAATLACFEVFKVLNVENIERCICHGLFLFVWREKETPAGLRHQNRRGALRRENRCEKVSSLSLMSIM